MESKGPGFFSWLNWGVFVPSLKACYFLEAMGVGIVRFPLDGRASDESYSPPRKAERMTGWKFSTMNEALQGGPLLVVSGVITTINGLING